MDAAGKDGVIRTVFSTLSPHGVKEYCFKAPTAEELSHDYLWRFWSALPARGNISIFNRSYYEDVLIGKVHNLYENQIMPERIDKENLIETRYREINDYEKYLYGTGTRVVKIFLNVSKDEQAKRFISRIDVPRKNWKISEGDIKEREYWDEYQEAFETMINKTATKNCPWYVVPADRKWYARLIVSRIVLETLREVDPQFPVVSDEDMERIEEYRESLVNSLSEYQKMKFLKESDDAEANEGGSEESAENIPENTEDGATAPVDEEGSADGNEETLGNETVTTNNEEQVEGSDIVNSTETENESSDNEVADVNSDDEKSEDDSEKDDSSKEDEEDKKAEDEDDEDEDEKEEKSSKKSKHEKKSKKWKKKRKKALKKLKSFKTEEEKKAYIKKMIAKGKYGYFVEEDDIEEGKCPFEEAENVSIEIVTE
jgi:PPK2 family polyphosphate:nucleotide phosphotransferase